MKKTNQRNFLMSLGIVSTIILCMCTSVLNGAETAASLGTVGKYSKQAKKIIAASGIKGGIIVHLGAGDGKLTAALRINKRFTVQGLERERTTVERSREYILEQDVYGSVSVAQFTGNQLPYADNLINLIVASKPGKVSMREMMRVLVPGGIAYIKTDRGWKKHVKEWPENIDDWSHFLHDASNNTVAEDEVVGPPRHIQWLAPPLWLRSHETPSGIQAMVSSEGRVFYIFDEGVIGITDPHLPSRWSIVCRDAFNGKCLWKRQLKDWGWRSWAVEAMGGKDWTQIRGMRTRVPSQNQCRLVAKGDYLYATLGSKAPVSILDAATGKTLTTIKGTKSTNQIRVTDNIGVAYVEPFLSVTAKQNAFVAFNRKSGEVIWKKDMQSKLLNLNWGIAHGKLIAQTVGPRRLICLNMENGKKLWETVQEKKARVLVIHDNLILISGWNWMEAYDLAEGTKLWFKEIPRCGRSDLFVIDGLVYPYVTGAPDAVARGYDIHTGEQKKIITAKNLRSPEHHPRCYRNKATLRYIITSSEGAEFVDLERDNHSQNNWVRGACRYGMMPSNGLLYVPSDQCFCSPGAMLRGFAALASKHVSTGWSVQDNERLKKGEAYGISLDDQETSDAMNWLTYRHDASRSGSTPASVPAGLEISYECKLGGKLTAPVAANGLLFVAKRDAHTLYAIDMKSGKRLWHFIAGARIDSPPTIYRGLVLFGSKDGAVYCLRANDGKLVWRFLAAPKIKKIGYFGQLESAWPVHGSVLVKKGIAYCCAGRSTYLDGGIYLYGLDPATGRVVYKSHLGRPPLDIKGKRDKSFYTLGANSELLVSEGGYIYMRQKKFTLDLEQIDTPVISNKGGMNVGLHIFSTASLLDGSWYNRTFWMYSKRWPGFQLANQAPKSGQLLVKDKNNTYAVKVFYRRNVHSPMFFPGREGYLLFADKNSTEPQIVGEKDAHEPVKWLPQSDFRYKKGKWRELEIKAFAKDKGVGYTRAELPLWKFWLPVRIRAMVLADNILFVAGPPDVLDPDDPLGAFEGRRGTELWAVSADDGRKLAEYKLEELPVFDGMAATKGRLYLSTKDGKVLCFGRQ